MQTPDTTITITLRSTAEFAAFFGDNEEAMRADGIGFDTAFRLASSPTGLHLGGGAGPLFRILYREPPAPIPADRRVMVDGHYFDMDAVANLMDDDIRERLHSAMPGLSEQQFVDAYRVLHEDRFGKPFVVN